MTGDRLQVGLARPTEERQGTAPPSLKTDKTQEGRGEGKDSGPSWNVALTRESKPKIEELCQQKTPTNDLLSIADNSGPEVGAPL